MAAGAIWSLGATEQWTLHRDRSTSGVSCRNARAFGLTMNSGPLTVCRYPSIPVSRRPRFLTRTDPLADEWALASAVAGHHNSRYEFPYPKSRPRIGPDAQRNNAGTG